MIVVTVFLSFLNQMEIHLVQNRKENCPHDHMPFNMKGNGNKVFSLYSLHGTEQTEIAYIDVGTSLVEIARD